MAAYQPGRGINKEALERLRSRKQADAAIADIPAEDRSQQWDRLLGEGAKKKLRCGICTRPLSEQEQEEKQLVCSACAAAEAATSTGAVAGPKRSDFVAEEFGPALFYYSWRACGGSRSTLRSPTPSAAGAKGSAAVPAAEAANSSSSAAGAARGKRGQTGLPPGANVAQLGRGAAVFQAKLVPEGHVGLGVVSFNLLAECYVRVEGQPWNAFAFCQDEHLSWKGRLPRIVRLLQGSLADVICLQEVVLERRAPSAGGAKEWTLPAWTTQLEGYTGVLQGLKQKEWEKTAERNQRVIGAKVPTGVATFYRTEELEECQASKSGGGSGLSVFLRRRSEAAGSGALEVAVGNVHLVGDPSKSEEHVKALSSVVKNFGKREHRVICGDFNGECEPGSSVAEWAAAEGFCDAPTGFSWAEPGKAMRLDHVLHSPGLHVQAASAPLSADEVASGLPCTTCPSDHAPIAVLLTAAKRTERSKCPW